MERVLAAMEAEERERAPAAANVDNAIYLAEPETLYYRGRSYRIEPISGLDGLRLMQVATSLQDVGKAAGTPRGMGEFVRAYRRVVSLIGHLARPRGWRGILWRLRPNPFRNATQAEIEAIMGFFGRCRTMSSVRYRGQEEAEPRQSTIRRSS